MNRTASRSRFKRNCGIQVLVTLSLGFMVVTPGHGQEQSKAKLQDQRKLLASLWPGADSNKVIEALGKPDEIRPIPEGHLLDGTRLEGDPFSKAGPETERCAYGPLAKGMFARVGHVSMDGNGKVVAVVSADYFAYVWADYFSNPRSRKLPEQVVATSDRAVETDSKMSCHVGPIQLIPAAGETPEGIKMNVTVKNSGTARFELKHDAAYSLRRFLLIEVHDSNGVLLFRDNEMRSHSPYSIDPAKWPVISILPEKEISEDLTFFPASGFGRFPPGRYSVRLYFPFEKGKYFPSNLVSFEVKESQPKSAER
jgi:hypothetical protein